MATPLTPELLRSLERAVLGAALLDREAAAAVAATVAPDWFLEPEHRALALLLERLASEGAPFTPATAEAHGADLPTLVACTSAAGNTTNAGYHARVLGEAHLAREGARLLARASGAIRVGGADPFEILDGLQRALADLRLEAESGAAGDAHIRHAVGEALRRTEEWRAGRATDYTSSGFYGLDRVVGGYPVGELTTLAAMTGAGKTSLLCQAVAGVAQGQAAAVRAGQGRAGAVVVFSAEMSREQIAHRAAAQIAGSDLRRLRARAGTPEEYDRHSAALVAVGALEIHVDDAPAPTFAHVAARLESVAARAGRIALVGLDYDEKMGVEGRSEELRVSAIARGLKDVAKRHDVAVLALSQYSRSAGPGETPNNSWLRYSGKKEHESAMIVHWWWPGYWARKGHEEKEIRGYDPTQAHRGHLVVTKNRFGPEGKIPLDFDPTTTAFHDPAAPSAYWTGGRPPSEDTPF